MKKIYSKDDCAPDALSAIDWLSNKLESPIDFLKHPSIEVNHEFNQDRSLYFCGDYQHYKIEYSCGVYEDLYEISLQETITELTKAATQLNPPLARP